MITRIQIKENKPTFVLVFSFLSLMVLTATVPRVKTKAWAESSMAQEYRIKAAFLYNFAKFVHWPESAFTSKNSPLVLCIMGDDPFGRALDMLKGKTVRGRPLRILKEPHVGHLPHCHIMFVASSQNAQLRKYLEKLRGQPILTVSDIPGFASIGGVIGFLMIDERIRFEINPKAAEVNRLQISSQLMKLARIVGEH